MPHNTYSICQLNDILSSARAILPFPDAQVNTLLYDSRKLSNHEQALFFALKGRRDGHHYIRDAYDGGVRNFVVAGNYEDHTCFPLANFFFVQDTLRALQQLAAFHRKQFDIPVIGITGSNGKTIVKEWLYQLLSPEYTIHRSPKSYNSQLGVALSLWQLEDIHDMAIIEAGISSAGEMEHLRQMISPDIAILTNVGPVHDDGFASWQQKISEKAMLFEGAEKIVYSPKYTGELSLDGQQAFTWGDEGEVDLKVIQMRSLDRNHNEITAVYREETMRIVIPFTDSAARENAVICWAVLLMLGYGHADIAKRMVALQPMKMRLELKKGINNCSVIDDSYSNDIASLSIALEFLKQQQQHTGQTLILSDIPGVGYDEDKIYGKVARLLKENKINRLITVGPVLQKNREKFSFLFHEAFPDTASFLSSLSPHSFENETILIKGARSFLFERISKALVFKTHETVLEINLNALEYNLNSYKSIIPEDVKLMAMVKAFSYGSGSFEIANLLQFNKVDYLAVAYVDEGVDLRKSGITLPIMVMSPDHTSFEALLTHKLEPEIYGFSILESFTAFLNRHNIKNYPIHVKIDTGMHRLGFQQGDIAELAGKLSATDTVQVSTVFSHLVASGEQAHDDFTLHQLRLFGEVTDTLSRGIGYPFLRHIANTAAIARWPQTHLDMVRLGIGLYGVEEGDCTRPLQQVGTLKTTITQIRQVMAGDSVGYGRGAVLAKDSTIATVKIGYADGYDRRFGNGVGQMIVNGSMVSTVGNICMDMCMLDVSDTGAQEGDEVIIFGDIAQMAEKIGTIPYEILAGISQRVKRVYFYE